MEQMLSFIVDHPKIPSKVFSVGTAHDLVGKSFTHSVDTEGQSISEELGFHQNACSKVVQSHRTGLWSLATHALARRTSTRSSRTSVPRTGTPPSC